MEQFIDVSKLEPPEPLERILEKLEALNEGDFLSVSHRREPIPLYAIIQENGFSWRCIEKSPAHFQIYIWRTNDQKAEQSIPRSR